MLEINIKIEKNFSGLYNSLILPQDQFDSQDLTNISLLIRKEEIQEHKKKLARLEREIAEVFTRKVEQKVEKKTKKEKKA